MKARQPTRLYCFPVPLGVKPVLGKAKTAKKIITVDGCPFECAKTIESIVLARDIGMKKVALHTDIGKGLGLEKYISEADIKKAKELIVKSILEKQTPFSAINHPAQYCRRWFQA